MMTLSPFDFELRTRIVSGEGVSAQVGKLARELGGRRALLVTDAGIVTAGHAGKAQAALERSDVACAVFDTVQENPTTDDIDACVAAVRLMDADILIALGGGSAIDTAKGANFLLTNGRRMADYRGDGKAIQEMLPLIAIPTTAGTGSEVQRFALISDAETHQKMACGDVKATPRIALLDPELTVSCPRSVTANAGIDALAHAVETAVTRTANPVSQMYSREAYRLIAPHLPQVLRDPDDLKVRGAMLLGATFAGLAIENSMLGAAHAAANPLTARFGVVHGQAVAVMLAHIVRFNAEIPAVKSAYEELAGSVSNLLAVIEKNIDDAELPVSLSVFGIVEADIPALAVSAAEQWTAAHNPRPVSVTDFEMLYRKTLIR
jgi:alcohol dehydrogenase